MGMMFDYVDNRTRGGAKNLYVGNEVKQLDANGLKTEFNASDNDELRAAFGSFDNYLSYMTERQGLIDAGSYNANWFDIGDDWDKRSAAMQERSREDFTVTPQDLNKAKGLSETAQLKQSAQKTAYNQWQNSPENQALMQKYGLDKPMVNQDGDQYAWNGSSYVKTMKVDDHLGVGDYLKVAAAVGASVLLGPQLTAALTPTLGSAGAAAASAGIMNSASQLALTGNLDLKDALTAAATAGLTDVAINAFNNSGIVDAAATMEGVGAQEQLQAAQNYLDSGVISQGTYDKFINTFNQTQEAINTAQTAGDAIDNTLGVLGVINTANNYIDILEDDKNVVWQDPNISDVLGDVQVQIPDYSQPQDAGSSSAADEAVAVEDLNADPFPDTTADDTTTSGSIPEIVNPDLTLEDLINADLPPVFTDVIGTTTLPPELTGEELTGDRQVPTEEQINNIYNEVLGRDADQSGMDYWTNQILNGVLTVEQARTAIENSSEAQGSNTGTGTGTGTGANGVSSTGTAAGSGTGGAAGNGTGEKQETQQPVQQGMMTPVNYNPAPFAGLSYNAPQILQLSNQKPGNYAAKLMQASAPTQQAPKGIVQSLFEGFI